MWPHRLWSHFFPEFLMGLLANHTNYLYFTILLCKRSSHNMSLSNAYIFLCVSGLDYQKQVGFFVFLFFTSHFLKTMKACWKSHEETERCSRVYKEWLLLVNMISH